MSAVSTPGLLLSPRFGVRRVRRLPVEGRVLVDVGDLVESDEVVARAKMPGPLHPVNAAAALGVPRKSIAGHLAVSPGDIVETGTLLASVRGLFGLLSREVRAPVSGIVDSVSADTGQIILRAASRPVEVTAYLAGKVVEVERGWSATIEADVALIQGVFGTGGEAVGELVVHDGSAGLVAASDLSDGLRKKILALEGCPGLELLRRAREVGVAGLVAGGVRGADLLDLAGREINLAATGEEDLGFVLVVTEGFGELGMGRRAWEIVRALAGGRVSISGATQVRAGVIRPELLGGPVDGVAAATRPKAGAVGTAVRVVRGRHFGALGVIREAPAEPRVLATGACAAIFEVELESGELVVVPRSNVEALAG